MKTAQSEDSLNLEDHSHIFLIFLLHPLRYFKVKFYIMINMQFVH